MISRGCELLPSCTGAAVGVVGKAPTPVSPLPNASFARACSPGDPAGMISTSIADVASPGLDRVGGKPQRDERSRRDRRVDFAFDFRAGRMAQAVRKPAVEHD